MATISRTQIKNYYTEGRRKGHEKLIIAWDCWDNFPLFVPIGEDAWEFWQEYKKERPELSVDEVIDLKRPLKEQINEGVKMRW